MIHDLNAFQNTSLINYFQITESIQRDINCLADGTRFAKKKSLERIRSTVMSHHDQPVLTALFATLCKPLLTLFHDPMEKCRESSITLVSDMTAQIANITSYLPYIIPMCVMRLGQKELIEPSEEIRQLMMELLIQLMILAKKDIALYTGDIFLILIKTVSDPFAEVKKLSCTCIISLSVMAPRNFYAGANTLLNPLLQSITHQHQKVRIIVIQALGALLNNGDNKMMDELITHFAQRTFDSCPPVRAAVYDVVGRWMCTLMDRYSYFHRLLPLILTGTLDEVPEIATNSEALLEAAGKQWEQENEQDIKDEMDFQREMPEAYGVLADMKRPRLGCRILVNRNLSKILPGLLNDLNAWVEETRLASAKLLHSCLFYAEDHVTQHLEKVMYGMYKASLEPYLATHIDMSAQILAQFVEPIVWKEFILSALAGASTGEVKSRVGVSPALCTSCLRVLASLIKGSKCEALLPITQELFDTLCKPEVNETAHQPLYAELQGVVEALLMTMGPAIEQFTTQTLFLILRLCSVQTGEVELEKAESLITALAELQSVPVSELYSKHAPTIVEQMKGQHRDWTRHSADHSLFGQLLLRSGPVVSKIMPDIYAIFKDCTSTEKDPELRMSFFALLGRLLRDAPSTKDSALEFSVFSEQIIREIILPNMEWRAGRTAGTVRTAAVSAFWSMLKSNLLTQTHLKGVQENLTKQLLSCIDDDVCATRLISCNCLNFLLTVGGQECFDVDQLHALYTDLLKRLDDSSDELRLAVTQTFLTYFTLFPKDYNVQLYKAHLQALYRGLLIHLDDSSAVSSIFYI